MTRLHRREAVALGGFAAFIWTGLLVPEGTMMGVAVILVLFVFAAFAFSFDG